MSSPLTVVGVRHHSPACARLVEHTVRRLRPRFVLIEGPADFNDRLSELTLPHQLPIALFTYRQDANGGHRASWSPFCAYSPEWVALTAAAQVGATARFVDLPAWDPAFDGAGFENRYADRHARHSDRLAELCARLGFEDVDALWDHLFEQPQAPGELAARLDRYFQALRADEPPEARDGPREDCMARWAAWAVREAAGAPVVLVCGGYHQPALERLWRAVPPEPPPATPPPDARVGSYLVPFSFRRLSSFAGYASGMPSPGYYQRVWDEGPAQAAEAMLFAAVAHLRDRKQRVSAADVIAASTLAAGLRNLRGHAALARVDVLDGLAGALLKDALEAPLPWTRRGALSPRTDPLLIELVAAFTGARVGALAPGTPRPPLVDDAFAELARAGVPLARESRRVKATLTDDGGAQVSAVLHRLRVLAIPGFELTRGPRLQRGAEDLSEEWQVVHRLETDAALIEAAVHGATLAGAAAALLEEALGAATGVAELASILERGAQARLPALTARALAGIARVAGAEPSFAAIGAALAKLAALLRGELVLGQAGAPELARVVELCFDRGLWLFEGIQGATAPLDAGQVGAVRALRDALRLAPLDRDRARAVAARRVRDAGAPPALRGAALGFGWSTRDPDAEYDRSGHAESGFGRSTRDPNVADDRSADAALVLGMARAATFGDFLGGLFALAREEVVRAPGLLAAIDAAVTGFGRDDFLIALPSLRQAFAYFPPRERLEIAAQVLAVGQAPGAVADPMQLAGARVDAAAVVRGAALERAAADLARRFNLEDEA